MARLIFALMVLISLARISQVEAAFPSDRIVVLISVDGLAHFYLDDSVAEMPTIRRFIAEGARAEKMKAVIPTVTWPNHTTLVTGVMPARHGVVGNGYFDREKGANVGLIGDPQFDKEQLVKSPTIYDAAHEAGLKTASIVWPASRSAKTLDWTVHFANVQELFERHATPSLLTEFKEAGIAYEAEAEGFKEGKGPARDELNVRMFNHVIHKHRPNLALFHLLEVDHAQHVSGPQSPEAYAAIKFADGCLRTIRDQLEQDFPGKATVFIVSDHGFFPIRKQIQTNVLFRQEQLLTLDGENKIAAARVRSVSQGGSTFIYVLDNEHRDALIERVVRLFANVEGVEASIMTKDYRKYGLADPADDPHSPDLVLCAKSGYSFSDSTAGDLVVTDRSDQLKGTHGYDPNHDEMHATFIAWGAGIKPGSRLGVVNNTDVSPTMARLMELKMDNLDGQVLDGILSK